MKKYINAALMMAAMIGAADQRNLYSSHDSNYERLKRQHGESVTEHYHRTKSPTLRNLTRQTVEQNQPKQVFNIKGHSIEARSRKDAIKIYNHLVR